MTPPKFSNQIIEQIFDCLHEHMSKEERVAFELHLAADAELQKEVNFQRLTLEELTHRAALQQQLEGLFGKAQMPEVVITPLRTVSRWYWAAAASVAVLIGIGYLFFAKSSPTQILIQKPALQDSLPSGRVENVPKIAEKAPLHAETGKLAVGEKIYNDYFEAQPSGLMRGDEETGAPQDSTAVFEAIRLMQKQKLNQAVRLLESASRHPVNHWQAVAEWYLAMGYLKQEQLKKAQKVLVAIKSNPDHPYSFKAEKILNEF